MLVAAGMSVVGDCGILKAILVAFATDLVIGDTLGMELKPVTAQQLQEPVLVLRVVEVIPLIHL